jgi:transposase InsO family protein
MAQISRAGYYKWIGRSPSSRQLENEFLAKEIQALYEEQNGILGYRQMGIALLRRHRRKYNHKRIYRLMSLLNLRSVCRRKRKKYIRSTAEITAENLLNRNFTAKRPNEKWLTDVTELQYGNGQKAYLSAILDLGDRRIVSYVLGCRNDNGLVFRTFDLALDENPNAKPLFHSDRGFQYTSKIFHAKLRAAGMVQSMSRVGRCLDNAPMEGFWGILKTEMYYLHHFQDYDSLQIAIDKYLRFYNYRRFQQRLDCLAPMEFYTRLIA